jgi:hypothetical protein
VPIPISQSNTEQLLLLTEEGELIRISFVLAPVDVDEHQTNKEGLASSFIDTQRFTATNWSVSAFTRLPDPEKVMKESAFFEGVLDNFFEKHEAQLDLMYPTSF